MENTAVTHFAGAKAMHSPCLCGEFKMDVSILICFRLVSWYARFEWFIGLSFSIGNRWSRLKRSHCRDTWDKVETNRIVKRITWRLGGLIRLIFTFWCVVFLLQLSNRCSKRGNAYEEIFSTKKMRWNCFYWFHKLNSFVENCSFLFERLTRR